jgi:hypothetical protein
VAAVFAVVIIGGLTWLLTSAYEAGLLTGRPPINVDLSTDYPAPRPHTETPSPASTPPPERAPAGDVPGGVWLPEQEVASGDGSLHASDFTRPR